MSRDEVFAWLRQQKDVDYITTIAAGEVILVMTRSQKLVDNLVKRGCTVRWYDRTEFSTKSGKSKADQQAEVLLGPAFWARQEEEVATA